MVAGTALQADHGQNTHEVCTPSTVMKRGQNLIVPCLRPGKKKSAGDKQGCGNLLTVPEVFVRESFALLDRTRYHIEKEWKRGSRRGVETSTGKARGHPIESSKLEGTPGCSTPVASSRNPSASRSTAAARRSSAVVTSSLFEGEPQALRKCVLVHCRQSTVPLESGAKSAPQVLSTKAKAPR